MISIPTGLDPDRFATYYRPVRATSQATGPVSVDVTKYLSTPGGGPLQKCQEALKEFCAFYSKLGDARQDGLQRHSEYVLTIPYLGLLQTDVRDVFKQCHMGKGTPGFLQAFAVLYTYWDKQTRGTSGYKPSAKWANLQNYADQNIGVDCNGFAGAYYGHCFPASGLQPHSVIPEHPTIEYLPSGKILTPNNKFSNGTMARTGIEQVRSGDVIVYTHKHVAVVGDFEYLAPDTNQGTFWVYQAKNYDAGGVQWGLYDITYKGNAKFPTGKVVGHAHAFEIKPEGSGKTELVYAISRPKGVPVF